LRLFLFLFLYSLSFPALFILISGLSIIYSEPKDLSTLIIFLFIFIFWEFMFMSIFHAVGLGVSGNEISKTISGSDQVSVERSVVAVSAGALNGAIAGGTVTIGAAALGVAVAPVAVPLAVASGLVAGIASFFD